MKIITDLAAHVHSLIASGEHLLSELRKHQSVTQAQIHAPETDKIQELHAAAKASAEEAKLAIVPASITEAPPVDNAHVAPGCEQFTPSPTMRAKMLVSDIQDWDHAKGQPVTGQTLSFIAVGGDKVQHGYPEDGLDEDNTFARWSPSGHLGLGVVNPDIIGKIKQGEKYYIDFTLANPAPSVEAANPPTQEEIAAMPVVSTTPAA